MFSLSFFHKLTDIYYLTLDASVCIFLLLIIIAFFYKYKSITNIDNVLYFRFFLFYADVFSYFPFVISLSSFLFFIISLFFYKDIKNIYKIYSFSIFILFTIYSFSEYISRKIIRNRVIKLNAIPTIVISSIYKDKHSDELLKTYSGIDSFTYNHEMFYRFFYEALVCFYIIHSFMFWSGHLTEHDSSKYYQEILFHQIYSDNQIFNFGSPYQRIKKFSKPGYENIVNACLFLNNIPDSECKKKMASDFIRVINSFEKVYSMIPYSSKDSYWALISKAKESLNYE